MRRYSRHNCDKTHRTYNALARCIFRPERPYWIWGEGPFALICRCDGLTISLHQIEREALADKRQIDRAGCCSPCERRHEIVAIRGSLEIRS
jgi:hypothetical protein